MDNKGSQDQSSEHEISTRPVSFIADPAYAHSYLKSCYESDEYHSQSDLLNSFQRIFVDVLLTNPAYSHLRTIDKSLLKVNDEILYNVDNKRYFIESIDNQNVVIKDHDKSISVDYDSITPIDDILQKIKPNVFADLYQNIRKHLDIKYYTEINFFQCFCDYFKANEKLLYKSLSLPLQERLVNELNESTGFMGRRKNKTNY